MIRCGICEEVTAPLEKPVRVVVATRAVVYPPRANAHRKLNDKKDGRTVRSHDPGGEGVEIVKEILAHRTCAEKKQG